MKAGYEARERARKEKEREREEREAEERREVEERDRDLVGWANKLKQEHEVIFTRFIGEAVILISTGHAEHHEQDQRTWPEKGRFE